MNLTFLVNHLLREPRLIIREILKRLPFVPLSKRIMWDATQNPQYSYGTWWAALQAHALGIDKMSVIEFGVAGGNGLLALEQIADEVSKELGMEIDIYGFDSGSGMPQPLDYRDLPYSWQPGFFKADLGKLRSRLKKAKLIIGDISQTILGFIEKSESAPIGFIAFDLDYYSSTMSAFRLFNEDPDYFLPRVYCYFDDCIGDDWELYSHYTGELLAINEFNQKFTDRKIAKIYGLSYKRMIRSEWNEEMFVFHYFSHPLYNQYIYPIKNRQLELKN